VLTGCSLVWVGKIDRLRLNTSTARPSGSKAFIDGLVLHLGRLLNGRKQGRKPKSLNDGMPDMFRGGMMSGKSPNPSPNFVDNPDSALPTRDITCLMGLFINF